MATRFCIRCGAGTEDPRLSFCPRCGTAYAGEQPGPVRPPADAAEGSAYIRVGNTRLPRLLPVALLAVLAVAGASVGVALSNRDDGNDGDIAAPIPSLTSFTSAAVADPSTEPPPENDWPTEPEEPEETESASSVVRSYYDHLNAGEFRAAWDMGGQAIAVEATYDEWVAGYNTTESITVDAFDDGYGEVDATITSTLTDGTVERYAGTYTVTDGEITDAAIQQAP